MLTQGYETNQHTGVDGEQGVVEVSDASVQVLSRVKVWELVG
jgi:hypothetical protein